MRTPPTQSHEGVLRAFVRSISIVRATGWGRQPRVVCGSRRVSDSQLVGAEVRLARLARVAIDIGAARERIGVADLTRG